MSPKRRSELLEAGQKRLEGYRAKGGAGAQERERAAALTSQLERAKDSHSEARLQEEVRFLQLQREQKRMYAELAEAKSAQAFSASRLSTQGERCAFLETELAAKRAECERMHAQLGGHRQSAFAHAAVAARLQRAQARGAHMERTLSDCKKLLLDQEDLRARALRGQALLAKAQSDATRAQHERSIACGRAEALERENGALKAAAAAAAATAAAATTAHRPLSASVQAQRRRDLLELAKVTSSLNVLKAQNTELVRKLATARIEAHEELLSGPAPHGGLPSTTLDKQKLMRLEGELQSCKERLGLADEQRDELSARHEAELQQMRQQNVLAEEKFNEQLLRLHSSKMQQQH